MHDDRDAIVGQRGFNQSGFLFRVLQVAAGKADVAAAFQNGGDAGAGAGGIVGEVHALVFLGEVLAQRADDLFHGGRAVGGYGALGHGGRGTKQHYERHQDAYELFHV